MVSYQLSEDDAMDTDEAQRVLARAAIIVIHLRRRQLAKCIPIPPCTLQHQPALRQGSSCLSALCNS